MSDLPKGWDWTSIGSICRTLSGGTPSRKNFNYYNGNIPWLKSGELNDGYISKSEEFITEEGLNNSSAKINNPETILIAMYGATVGKLGILNITATTNQAICAITPPDFLYHRFIFWYLKSRRYELLNSRIGGAQPNISQQIIKNLNIPLPPLPEQHRIVARIEELFTKLDAGVAALRKAKALLKQYRQSVLKAAVEGKLTEEWRKEHADEIEPASVLLERIQTERKTHLGKKYKPPKPIDKSNLPELPKGWVWIYLGYLVEWSNGKGLTKKNIMPGSYDVYGGNGIVGTHTKFLSESKCIVVGRVGAHCGNVNIASNKSWITDNAIYSTWISEHLNIFYSQFLLTSLDLNNVAGGSGQPYIKQSLLNPLVIPLPSISEQFQIVIEVERLNSIIDESEQIIDAELKRSRSLRQSILKRAFEGKLVPQDPNDPPASELLKRIKAEKEMDYKN